MRAITSAIFVVLLISPAAAQQATLININGAWVRDVNCTGTPHYGDQTTIAQAKSSLQFINECRQTSVGYISNDNDHIVVAEGWHHSAIVSPDQKSLTFDNGTIWRRE
jgi:Tfp pilus assembly protein PilW